MKIYKKEIMMLLTQYRMVIEEMKPEPLKNKWHFGDELLESGDRYYKEKSVRSAVEFLKERILKDGVYEIEVEDGKCCGVIDAKKVFNRIDEAFEDVVKEDIKQNGKSKRTATRI